MLRITVHDVTLGGRALLLRLARHKHVALLAVSCGLLSSCALGQNAGDQVAPGPAVPLRNA